jgi:hypothetical protein
VEKGELRKKERVDCALSYTVRLTTEPVGSLEWDRNRRIYLNIRSVYELETDTRLILKPFTVCTTFECNFDTCLLKR